MRGKLQNRVQQISRERKAVGRFSYRDLSDALDRFSSAVRGISLSDDSG